jgi:hypothetical protein
MLAAKRGRVSGSPARRVGLSSAIDSARTRGSCAASWGGLYGLAEGGPGVAAVSIFGQRGVGEVEDVNVEVDGERAGREMVKCGPGGTGWAGGEFLAGGHVQAEPVSSSRPASCRTGAAAWPAFWASG